MFILFYLDNINIFFWMWIMMHEQIKIHAYKNGSVSNWINLSIMILSC